MTEKTLPHDGGNRPVHRRRAACRGCGGDRLRMFLSLGASPLANAFLQGPEEFAGERRYPLDVYFCEACSLVQLVDVIDPEVLFRNYIYVTGTSDTMAEHNRGYARRVAELLRLGSNDLVVEIASNDGSLLANFHAAGIRTLGVEPAENIAELARSRGIETVARFFDENTALEIREEYGLAKAVIANNVLAHVDETRDFLLGCTRLLDPDGLVVVEVPYLRDLVERLEYDTIYHEHLCYFSVRALQILFASVGLSIVQVEHQPVHGGSLRVYAGHLIKYPEHGETAVAMAGEEARLGMDGLAFYEGFADLVAASRHTLRALLADLKSSGQSLAGYGAPAKSTTLLSYTSIDTSLVPYTVDRSPLKVGLYTPGAHLPVLAVDTLLEQRPDSVLILAWNFADEIVRQQDKYRRGGGRFILPLPEPKVIPQ